MTPTGTAGLKAILEAGRPVEAADLAAVDWNELPCEDARFVGCSFDDAAFPGTVFGGARFTRCRFLRCRFSHADLQDSVFQECGFVERGASTPACTFAFSDLRRAHFTDCDLSFCLFDRSGLFGVEMDRCNLMAARFPKADFSHAYSRKVVTSRATFRGCNLDLADLSQARLAECDFTGSRLRETDLSASDLSGATLRDCNLFQAVLAGAKLENADLRGAEISGLNLLALGSFAGLKVNQDQQHILLTALGVDVHPG